MERRRDENWHTFAMRAVKELTKQSNRLREAEAVIVACDAALESHYTVEKEMIRKWREAGDNG